jgi:hypothetical protein
MKITKLDVTNLRGFEHASFELDPSFTLLVGVNGVGKSSVLEALRISLSRVMPKFTASKAIPLPFAEDDTRIGSPALTVRLDFQFADGRRHFLMHLPHEKYVADQEGSVRQGAMTLPDQEEMSQPWPKVDKDGSQPIALFFGVRRSHPTDERINTGRTVTGQAIAYADALSTARPLHLADMASWVLAQEALTEELPRARMHLDALKSAASRFLPTCTDLRATNENDKPRLLITKGGVELDVRHLSEGERGMLALALDLTRRLSQANPGLDDPVRDGVAVVLIDELDMHLHPSWQRQISGLLTQTFRNCQFIATTHSPQIFGEIKSDQIRKIDGGKVYSPGHSYGVDSSRLLEEEMGTPPRNADVAAKLDVIASLIGEEKGAEARKVIDALAEEVGASDPEITRARLLLDFMDEGDE